MSATLRLRGDEVTALVSDRYASLDAEELTESVRHALVQHGAVQDVRVRSLATGLTDVLRLVFPAEQQAIKWVTCRQSAWTSARARSGVGRPRARHLLEVVLHQRFAHRRAAGAFSFRHVGESQRLRDGIAEAIPTCLAQARGLMNRWKLAST